MEWVCVMCESETATLNCGRGAEALNTDILSTTVMCVCVCSQWSGPTNGDDDLASTGA